MQSIPVISEQKDIGNNRKSIEADFAQGKKKKMGQVDKTQVSHFQRLLRKGNSRLLSIWEKKHVSFE